ncbi:MAG: DUF998 domain-containing protein [Methanobacteriota archaeon]
MVRERIRIDLVSIGAFCGILAPIVLFVAVLVASLLRPGYDHVSWIVSALGVGPNALVMNSAFFAIGLLEVTFAFGLYRGIGTRDGSKIGPALVAVSGLGFAASGFVPCSTADCHQFDAHGALAFVGFLPLLIAPLVLSRPLKGEVVWRGYRTYSIISGLVAIGVLPLLFAAFQGPLWPWVGAIQRVEAGILFVWLEVTGIRLLGVSLSRALKA